MRKAKKLIYVGTYIGQVMKKHPAGKWFQVCVLEMKLDPYLSMFFNKKMNLWVADPKETAQIHDIVLLKPMQKPPTPTVRHCIHEKVFPLGEIRDPVTGRRCRGMEFIDENRRLDPLPPKPSQEI